MSNRSDRPNQTPLDRQTLRQPRLVVALMLSAAMLLGACGGSDKENADAPKTLEQRVNALFTDFTERQREIEEEVTACMKALGWEYRPVDYSAFDESTSFYGEQQNAPEAFKEKWGYGIVTVVGREDEAGINAFTDDFTDPNEDYVQSLSESEIEQYYKDLYGSEFSMESDGGAAEGGSDSESSSAQDESCQQKAITKAVGDNPLFTDDELSSKLDNLGSRIEDDDRVKTARKEWATCMKDAGFDYADEEAIGTYLSTALAELRGESMGSEGELDLGDFPTDADGNPDGDLFFSTSTTKVPDPSELKKLQDEELAIAKQDIECSRKHVNDVLDTVRAEEDQRFADENPEVIAALEQLESTLASESSE